MKKIFYYTDVLPFLSRGEDAIDKLIINLEMFHEAADSIRLIWHPWSGTEKYMENNDFLLLDKYRGIVKAYREAGWGELDENDSFSAVVEVLHGCDCYYGDMSDLIYEAQNVGLPVMLQNVDAR
ncbi:hypothetical protein [Butyrivibrio fibrisolvens]|uniref:hypothetical protein n=1 Tax=Butyrivibrio fibrisolvens TaxID=831 RepID=UPI0003B43945|nr:hypothetical protein [Butyrivibrio fibrisolvens]